MTTGKMRILVVEDKQENIEAAKVMLADHDLVVVSGFDQALECLTEQFNTRGAKEAINLALIGTDWKCIWVDNDGKVGAFEGPEGSVNMDQVPEVIRQKATEMSQPFVARGYDVVLTDVMYPKGGDQCMGPKGLELVRRQGEMPYGPVVLLHALQNGVKRIGVLTSGDHHSDPFVFAFDRLGTISLGEVKIVASNRMNVEVVIETMQRYERPEYGDKVAYAEYERRCYAGEIINVKDWAKLLERVIAEGDTVDDD